MPASICWMSSASRITARSSVRSFSAACWYARCSSRPGLPAPDPVEPREADPGDEVRTRDRRRRHGEGGAPAPAAARPDRLHVRRPLGADDEVLDQAHAGRRCRGGGRHPPRRWRTRRGPSTRCAPSTGVHAPDPAEHTEAGVGSRDQRTGRAASSGPRPRSKCWSTVSSIAAMVGAMGGPIGICAGSSPREDDAAGVAGTHRRRCWGALELLVDDPRSVRRAQRHLALLGDRVRRHGEPATGAVGVPRRAAASLRAPRQKSGRAPDISATWNR